MGPAKGPCLHGSPSVVVEGFIHECGESHRGRVAEEGDGGQEEEEEEEAEAAGVGTGEDTDSDDDDDDGDDDEVADDVEWDILRNEDALIGIGSSLQESRPFLFHGGEGASREPTKMGHIVGLPEQPIGVGGSVAMPEVPAEVGDSVVMPQDPRGASPSTQEHRAGSKWPRPHEAEQR